MEQKDIMSTLDLINLIAALSSIILAILALVLSIVFYKWSDKSNKEIVTVAQAIDSNTKKIENLFDRLYNDTFGMMKSNVEAMQKQLYHNYNFSSGDSSLNEPEILEESLLSIVSKSKLVTKESITVFIQRLHPKNNFSDIAILDAVKRLEDKGSLFVKENIITIGNSESNSAESE